MLQLPSTQNTILYRIRATLCPLITFRPAHSFNSKRRPARLVLSTKVAQSTPKQKTSALLPTGGLNRRETTLSPSALANRRVSAESRQARGKDKREFKQMKMSQSLSTVSRTARLSMQERLNTQGRSSFRDFELLPSIPEAVERDALPGLQYWEPTPVQKLVVPTLLDSAERLRKGDKKLETFLVAAETGSGKTLAYTLPLLNYLKQEELELRETKERLPIYPNDPDFEIPAVGPEDDGKGKPRALIIVPTSELVAQVGGLLKSLSHIVKFRSALLSREVSGSVLRKLLFHQPADIVVSTPQLFNSLTENSPNVLEKCSHIIIDEADSLFDRSFSPITSSIISRSKNLRRLTLCSATIPRSLDTRIRDLYPDIKRIVTPNVHVIPRRVRLTVVDIDGDLYKGNRMLACADTLYNIAKENTEDGFLKRVIVFVNERKATGEVAKYLRSKDIDAVALDRDASGRSSADLMAIFTSDKTGVDKFTKGRKRMKVLVATDIMSRGVDTKTVKTVLLFDVPHTSVDFIHRIGRTGRMGRRGRAIVLVDKHSNKGWIKDLKMSMHMGGPLI